MTTPAVPVVKDEQYKWGFYDDVDALFKANPGLNHEIIDVMSDMKGEPQWMREFRHRALDTFWQKQDPPWGTDQLKEIDFDSIHYYVRATDPHPATTRHPQHTTTPQDTH